jgi:NAD(P)-dependent dehydrogenase (short-subunit alcohol dehydrogenase family)
VTGGTPAPGPAAGPGRSALITGASRGIGRAIAQRLAAAGYGLTLTGRHRDVLQDVASGLPAPDLQVVTADMADEDEVRAVARRHGERFGDLDLLVLSAGVGTSGPIIDYPMRRLDRQVAVNLRAPFALTQECLPALRRAASRHPRHGARIAAIASLTGIASEPGLAAYAATKAALISLCQSLNTEESRNGVSATALAPGYVDTEMSAWIHDRINPADMIEAADIAHLVFALTQISARAIVPSMLVTRPGETQWSA